VPEHVAGVEEARIEAPERDVGQPGEARQRNPVAVIQTGEGPDQALAREARREPGLGGGEQVVVVVVDQLEANARAVRDGAQQREPDRERAGPAPIARRGRLGPARCLGTAGGRVVVDVACGSDRVLRPGSWRAAVAR